MSWAGYVVRMREMRNAYNILVGMTEGNRPHGRIRRRWEDNIRIDLREGTEEIVHWIHVALSRDHWRTLVNTVMSLRVPYKAGNL